jgi:hypothetical protein
MFAYVDHEKRAYLLADAGNTLLSAIYFMENGAPEGSIQKTAQRIVGACTRFNVAPGSALEKIASTPEPREQPAPTVARTAPNVVRAAINFTEKLASYDPQSRRAISQDLVKEAVALGVSELPEEVVHYAANTWNPDCITHLTNRRAFLEKAGKTNLLPVINEFISLALDPTVDKERYASELYNFDKEAGLLQHYDTRLADAYGTTFGLPMTPEPVDAGPMLEEAIQKFAMSEEAKAVLAPELITKLAYDPSGTLEALDDTTRAYVIARLADVLEG